MVKNPPANAEDARDRHRFDPWVGKIPWSRKWQPIPVLLPGKSHGRLSLRGYSPWSHKESDTTELLHFTSNSREGTQLHPSTENWIKDLLSIVPPIRIRPSFLQSPFLPLGSFHKLLILICQRADCMKTTITGNYSN